MENNNEAPNENPSGSNSSSSALPIVEIYISLPFAPSGMEIHCSCHNGFSIRAYAASKRGTNPDVSSVHPSMGGSDGRGFPPMGVPPSRYWRCRHCSCVSSEEEVVAPAGAQEGVPADMDEIIPPAEPNLGAPEQGLPADANEEIRDAANSEGMQQNPRAPATESTRFVGVDVNADMEERIPPADQPNLGAPEQGLPADAKEKIRDAANSEGMQRSPRALATESTRSVGVKVNADMEERIPPADQPNLGAPEQGLPADANEQIRGAANSEGMQRSPRATTTESTRSVRVNVNTDMEEKIPPAIQLNLGAPQQGLPAYANEEIRGAANSEGMQRSPRAATTESTRSVRVNINADMEEIIPPAVQPNLGAPEQGLPADANEEIRGAANSEGMQRSPRAATTESTRFFGVDVNADAAVEISMLPSPTIKTAAPTVTDADAVETSMLPFPTTTTAGPNFTDAVKMSILPSPTTPKTAARTVIDAHAVESSMLPSPIIATPTVTDTDAFEISLLPSPTPKAAVPTVSDADALEISMLPSPSTPKIVAPTVVATTFIGVAQVPAEPLNADAVDLQNQSLENTDKDAARKPDTPETDSSQEVRHSKKRRHRSLADILDAERASAGGKAVSEVQPILKRKRSSWKDKGKAKVTDKDDSVVLLPPRGEGLFIGTKGERARNRSGFAPPLRKKKAKQTLAFDLSKKVAELIQTLPAPPAVTTLENQQEDQNHAGLPSHSRLTELSELDLNLSLGSSSKAYHNQKRGGKGIRKRNGTQRGRKGLLDLNKTVATIPLQEKKDFLRIGPKESDQRGSDDIPMDIVELLAKKQHERESSDAVHSPIVHGSSNITAEGASPSVPQLPLAPLEEHQSQGLPTFGLAPYPADAGRAGLFPPPFNFGSGGLLNQQGQQQRGKTISDIKADEWRKTPGAARFSFTKPGTSASASRASGALMSLMDGRSGTGLSLGSTRTPSRPSGNDWKGLLTGSMFFGQLHLKDSTPNPSASFQTLRLPSAVLSGHIPFRTPELLRKAGSSTSTSIIPRSDQYIPYLHDPRIRARSLAQRFLRPEDSNRAAPEAIAVPAGVVRTGRNESADGVCRTNRNPAEFSVPEPDNMYTLSSRDLNTRKRKPYKKRTPGEKAKKGKPDGSS